MDVTPNTFQCCVQRFFCINTINFALGLNSSLNISYNATMLASLNALSLFYAYLAIKSTYAAACTKQQSMELQAQAYDC